MAEDDTSNNNSGADNSNNNNTTASSPPTPSPPDNKKSSPPPSSPPPSSPPPSKDSPPPSSPPPSSPPPSKNSPPPSKDSSPPQSESGDKNGNDKGNDKDNNNNKSSPPPPDKQAGAENNDNKNNTPPPAENQSGAANNKDNNNSGGGANNENNKTPPAAPSGAESTTTNNNNADNGNGNTNANANTNTNADGGSNKNNNNGNSNSGKNAPADNQASPTPASKTPSSATPKNNNNSPTPASRVPSPPGVTSSGTPATKNSPAALNSPPSSSTSPSQASPDGSSNTNSGSSGGGGGSSGGKILTYSVIGAGGVGIILIALILFCVIRSKKKKRQPQFYGDQKDNWGNHQNWQNHPPGTDPSKLPPPPGGNAWQTQPGQPLTSSGEWSSQYSGGPHRQPLPPPSPNYAVGFNQSSFSYEELATATAGFSQGNLLGQGGFGYVHKGVLPNGKEVAVKSLKSGSGQGDREFQAEVEIISRVHHRHLVSLVGYCIANGQKMLVYEFVPNKTLEHHLHGRGLPVMDWETRMRIALGSAKGLAYLHEDCHPRIIHRDIKAANILIDNNFEAMVADFGLAKLTNDTNTHVSTRVMGTFGYLAPEYASSGKLSEKSDVFSFGVMLLELITGKRPVDASNAMEDSLVDWARPLLTKALEDGNYDELADPRMERNYVPHEMVRMIACGAASIRHSAKKRPRMSQIVRALEGDSSLEDLNDGTRPGHSSVYGVSSNATTEYSASSYQADMEKFRKLALGSQEFTSGEMGGTSSGDSRELRIPTGIPNKP